MRARRLLFVLCCSSILTVTGCIKADGHLCVSDYFRNISCILNISGNPVGESSTSYSLKFFHCERRYPDVSCPLTVTSHGYSCNCELKHSSDRFTDYDEYEIKVCAESDCHLDLETTFQPSRNIQLTPPPELLVDNTSQTWNITLKSRYDEHPYLANFLKYELLLQMFQNSKVTNKILPLMSPARSELIDEGSQLTADAEHCIKARFMADERYYDGVWSKWSEPKCRKPKAAAAEETFSEQESVFVILAKCLGPVCACVGVLLLVLYSPAARMKIKTLSHTPSPAPFFQPLYQQHHGNLQEWLSSHGEVVVTYKTEEISTTNVVTVVPKSITKHPEESQISHDPPVTQLVLTQCPTSYVSLPGMHKAPPPVTMVCPKDTSYTQLPCAVWGLSVAEVEVSSPPPKDFLELSCADSGCSCEDLSQSPQFSLPASPAEERAPPCYSSDYCILNKTAEGVVPVLVSKENSVKASPDCLQKDEG
ncbi:interleukin-21 receptor-like [Stegastes partitus]|uniref:Interleukin-21 receptor-like n=1 Tax=Stegastes partitus TaxID=144197 RepID=A0A9Y4N296_9TELE|nr:PREDICTED: interleukin-21 receptor-like [Stegastes partitus]